MKYLDEAFDGFRSQIDEDAALKLALSSIISDRRFDDLSQLLDSHGNVGGLEGDPGWLLERRRPEDATGYDSWPATASFRAFVDPEGYELAYPEFFFDDASFCDYLNLMKKASEIFDDVETTNFLNNMIGRIS